MFPYKKDMGILMATYGKRATFTKHETTFLYDIILATAGRVKEYLMGGLEKGLVRVRYITEQGIDRIKEEITFLYMLREYKPTLAISILNEVGYSKATQPVNLVYLTKRKGGTNLRQDEKSLLGQKIHEQLEKKQKVSSKLLKKLRKKGVSF